MRAAVEGVELTVRALVVNDSFTAVPLSRNAFTGPSLVGGGDGSPAEVSVEATYLGADEPMTLQPFTVYGRDRTFTLPAGAHRFRAEYRVDGAEPPRLETTIDVSRRPTAG